MILKDNSTVKYLHAYKDGKIKQGLGIGCQLDNHFLFKRAEFNMVLGLDNVGKTNWLLWYLHVKLNLIIRSLLFGVVKIEQVNLKEI